MILILCRVLFTEKMGKVREGEGEEGREKGRGRRAERRGGGQREGEGDREKGRGTRGAGKEKISCTGRC